MQSCRLRCFRESLCACALGPAICALSLCVAMGAPWGETLGAREAPVRGAQGTSSQGLRTPSSSWSSDLTRVQTDNLGLLNFQKKLADKRGNESWYFNSSYSSDSFIVPAELGELRLYFRHC